MSNISIEIVGLDKLLADVERTGGNAKPLVETALINSTDRIQKEAISRAPHRTGTLQRSILTQVDYPQAEVAVHEKYGVFLEEGTGLYGRKGVKITPKRAKVLAFKVGGRTVFARSVRGIKARPYFRPGIRASRTFIDNQFIKVIDRLVAGLAGRER